MKKMLLFLSLLVISMFLFGCGEMTEEEVEDAMFEDGDAVAGQALKIPDSLQQVNCQLSKKTSSSCEQNTINTILFNGVSYNVTNCRRDGDFATRSCAKVKEGFKLQRCIETCPDGCDDSGCIEVPPATSGGGSGGGGSSDGGSSEYETSCTDGIDNDDDDFVDCDDPDCVEDSGCTGGEYATGPVGICEETMTDIECNAGGFLQQHQYKNCSTLREFVRCDLGCEDGVGCVDTCEALNVTNPSCSGNGYLQERQYENCSILREYTRCENFCVEGVGCY